ncbi:MAG: hypothetical protein HUU50_01050 [Candidatus Brocadiae bacterium]|nr:hypothetical protein [Candidatus Brocadiia bacterium]
MENSPSSSAQRVEIRNAEQQRDIAIENCLGQALMYFKLGNKNLGQFFMERSLEKARNQNIEIPLSTISAVMDGKAPEIAIAKPNTNNPENYKQASALLEQMTSSFKQNMLEVSQPIKNKVEEVLQEMMEKIQEIMGNEPSSIASAK